jgi:hypothetical protein
MVYIISLVVVVFVYVKSLQEVWISKTGVRYSYSPPCEVGVKKIVVFSNDKFRDITLPFFIAGTIACLFYLG